MVQRNFFPSPPQFGYPLVVEHRIATLRSLCRGTVIDSSLVAGNATGERVYTHTIARQTRSHAQDSCPVEMKLRRGVDIPPVPLLNWNLIARPRCSITPCVFSAAPMQIIRCTRVSRHATSRHAAPRHVNFTTLWHRDSHTSSFTH